MVLAQAFILTACVFIGLTAYVLMTKKDFSALGAALGIGTMLVIGLILTASFFGGIGGTWITIVCVVLMAGWVLYDTSNVLHHHKTNQAVAASVNLLVDFVLMFLNILMLLTGGGRD